MEVNPMPIDADSNLMERIRERDEDAFEQLLGRYQDPLRRHLTRIVVDGDAAGDLAQEVFLRMWTRTEQWDGRASVKSWLFRIATNLALNHLRTVRRRRETALEPPPSLQEERERLPAWLIDNAAETPHQIVERAESVRKLSGLVSELSDEKREVWTLIHDEEMDMAGAAQKLGVPTGTVKSRLYYARQQLAREWNKTAQDWEKI